MTVILICIIKFKFKMIASYNYQQKAIPLVVVNPDTNKYELTLQAISLLKSIQGPIGVISVAGLYRTGKSYLLNRILLNKQKGFGVGNTVIACTKGLWCWGKPLIGTTSDGKSIKILVIDSQGIGATEQDANHDTKIFTLAVLASSCFIYNSMGSIDQNALQNLSLVVNLTKHIQLQSQNHGQEDPERIANYFPSFYWVVRDFSLQLVDPQNNPITQKQYLQRALMPQNGFSDDVQEKNRIRRLLTAFFKERECFTFVRPQVDQDKLQNLDKIDLKELRPQFVDQVLNFRTKVISKIKAKTMNEKVLDGTMYCNMLQSYVQAINDGAVPNIQSAWNYMCMQKCQSVKNQCFKYFENETSMMKFPVFQQQFQQKVQKLREQTLAKFRKTSMGDVSQKYEKDMYIMVKDKIKQLRDKNAQQVSTKLQAAVHQIFGPISKKSKHNEYSSYDQFQSQCSEAYNQLLDIGMNFPGSKIKILELYKKVQRQGIPFLIKNINNKMQQLNAMAATKQALYLNQIAESKQLNQKTKKLLNQKIAQLDKENIEAKNRIQKLQFDLNKINRQKQFEEENLNKTFNIKRALIENENKQLQQKSKQDEQKCKQLQKSLFVRQKQWDKQKSVMKAKLQNNMEKIQQLQSILKTKQYLSEKSRSEQNLAFKETINKLQHKKSQLQIKNMQIKEMNEEFQEQIRQLQYKLSEVSEKLQKKQKKSKEQIGIKSKEIEKLKQESFLKKKQMQEQLKDIRQKLSRQSQNLQQGNTKQKNQIIQLKNKLSKLQHEYKEKIHKKQTDLEFSEMKAKELQSQLASSRMQFQAKINKCKETMSKESIEKQRTRIFQVQRQTKIKITQIQTKYESQKRSYNFQLQTYKSKCSQLEKNLRLIQDKLLNQQESNSKIQSERNNKIKRLQSQLKDIQNSHNEIMLQRQSFLNQKVKQLQAKLQKTSQKLQDQRRSVHQKFEQQVKEMKTSYLDEIMKLEQTRTKEREKLQRKYNEQSEQRTREFEEKLSQTVYQHQQIVATYIDQIRALQNKYQQSQKDLLNKQSEFIKIEKDYSELKESSRNKQIELTNKFDQLTLNYRTEKNNLQNKISQIQVKANQMEKQILNKNNECNLLSIELERLKSTLTQLQQANSKQKIQYTRSIQYYKNLQKQKENQNISQKLQYQKQNALLTQQLRFKTTKCGEIQSQMAIMTEECQQKIRNIKRQTEETIFSRTQKIIAQNKSLQTKYEALKKSFKQKQLSSSKEITSLNTQLAVLQQKLANMQKAFLTHEAKAKSQILSYQRELENLKTSSKEQNEVLVVENGQLKKKIQQVQSKYKEIQRKMDRQLSVANYKYQNMEQAKQNQRVMLNDKIKLLQEHIQSYTKSAMNTQSQAQSKHLQAMTKTETSYKMQISQMTQTYNKTIHQNLNKIRQDQEELKKLREQLNSQKKKRQNSQKDYQFRFTQWHEQERKFAAEIEKLKRQRQIKSLQNQKNLEREKQILKEKLAESQNKYRKLEMDKTAQLFQNQRLRTQFRAQKNIMEQNILDMKQTIQKLERDKTIMTSDVNKLKEEKRRSSSFIKFDKGLQQRRSTITMNGKKYQGKSTIKKEQYESSSNKENFTMNESLFLAD